jgi:hypothetical protein
VYLEPNWVPNFPHIDLKPTYDKSHHFFHYNILCNLLLIFNLAAYYVVHPTHGTNSMASLPNIDHTKLLLQPNSQQQQQRGVQSGRIFKSEGLGLPSDHMAFKSAFHNGGGGRSSGLLIRSQGVDASIAAVRFRVTMRVATTKGAYICRDCG